MKIFIKDYETEEILIEKTSDYIPRVNDFININGQKYKISEVLISYFSSQQEEFATIIARQIN